MYFSISCKENYAKSNSPFFEFAYSTTHSAEKKEVILKDQKHNTLSLSYNENTLISNYSNSKFENDKLDSINIHNRNRNRNDIPNTSTPLNAYNPTFANRCRT